MCLSRYEQEAVVLTVPGYGPIRIVVCKSPGSGKTRLAFDAPREVVIMREELLEPRTAGQGRPEAVRVT